MVDIPDSKQAAAAYFKQACYTARENYNLDSGLVTSSTRSTAVAEMQHDAVEAYIV